MEQHALVRERPRRPTPLPHPDRMRLAADRQARHEEPHVAVVLFRWLALYAILMSALWAFLTSPAVD